MASALAKALTGAVVRRLAGEETYTRGDDYRLHGHVLSLEEQDGIVTAIVRGQREYTVRLVSDEGMLDYGCDCEAGAGGAFCKHCAAAALAWLEQARKGKRAKPGKMTMAIAETILAGQEKDVLIREMLEWAKDSGEVRSRLLVFASRRAGSATVIETVREACAKAFRGAAKGHRQRPWMAEATRTVDAIERLLGDGRAGGVVELCEFSIRVLARNMNFETSSIGGLIERLESLHFRACTEARPEPRALGQRLFVIQTMSEDVFKDAIEKYRALLGEEGLSAYASAAKAKWKEESVRVWTPLQSRTRRLAEALARARGDLDFLEDVLGWGGRDPARYVALAEAFAAAGHFDRAIEWVQRGLADPHANSSRLGRLLAELYIDRGDSAEALEMVWSSYQQRPVAERYRNLLHCAEKAGVRDEWRGRALDQMRRRIAGFGAGTDRSLLVELLIAEGAYDEAWNEAREGGCSPDLWRRLAVAREDTRPEDAVEVYWKLAEREILDAKNSRYDDAVRMLIHLAELMKRMGQPAEFERQLAQLRFRHGGKRNLVAEFPRICSHLR